MSRPCFAKRRPATSPRHSTEAFTSTFMARLFASARGGLAQARSMLCGTGNKEPIQQDVQPAIA